MVNINNVLSPKAIVKNVENAIQSPVKSLSIKPDVFTMSPTVKNSVKQQIKKFDNPNIFQKACRFISKSKIGKALVFGAMALATIVAGKSIADNIEENVQ